MTQNHWHWSKENWVNNREQGVEVASKYIIFTLKKCLLSALTCYHCTGCIRLYEVCSSDTYVLLQIDTFAICPRDNGGRHLARSDEDTKIPNPIKSNKENVNYSMSEHEQFHCIEIRIGFSFSCGSSKECFACHHSLPTIFVLSPISNEVMPKLIIIERFFFNFEFCALFPRRIHSPISFCPLLYSSILLFSA